MVNIAIDINIGCNSENSAVTAYPSVIGATESTTYSVKVNGKSVYVEDRGSDRNYAHFAFTGIVMVVVTVNESVSSYDLSPKSFNISSSFNGTDIKFTLDKSRKLIFIIL